MIQHSDKIPDYLELIKDAANKGELPKRNVAMMEDRYLMHNGQEQIYGTQGTSLKYNSENPIHIIWPIKDVENVNQRRKEIGYNTTIEEYGELLYGDEFVFKHYTLEEVEEIKNQ